MYEYDVYADARRSIPRLREPLQAMDGEYHLVKTDILAHTMSFSSSKDALVNVVTIPTSRVREIMALNRAGKKVDSILGETAEVVNEPTYRTEEDSITRFDKAKKRKKRNNRNNHNNGNDERSVRNNSGEGEQQNQQERKDGEQQNRQERKDGEPQRHERREGEQRQHRHGRHRHNRRDGKSQQQSQQTENNKQ